MGDLRVELHRVDALLRVRHRAEAAVFAAGDGGEALRRARHVVGVAHPDDGLRLHAHEERAGRVKIDRNAAIFSLRRALDHAAERMGGQLHAVADAQHRHAERVDRRVDARGVRIEHGGRAAGENHADRLLRGDIGKRGGVGDDLAEDLRLAHAARDELGILRAEVHDDDALHVMHRLQPPCVLIT